MSTLPKQRNIRFDARRHRAMDNADVAATLEEMQARRQGIKHVIFNARHNDVMAMKACPVCRQASPLTQCGQFCCKQCVILFN